MSGTHYLGSVRSLVIQPSFIHLSNFPRIYPAPINSLITLVIYYSIITIIIHPSIYIFLPMYCYSSIHPSPFVYSSFYCSFYLSMHFCSIHPTIPPSVRVYACLQMDCCFAGSRKENENSCDWSVSVWCGGVSSAAERWS